MKSYLKPAAICAVRPSVECLTSREAIAQFIASEKSEIVAAVANRGYRLRMATWGDVDAIQGFHRRCWGAGCLSLEEPTLLFRILHFGFVPIIEANDGRILACNINESYDDAARTSYGVRITVDPDASGDNFGAALARYSSLLGMERGSRVRRAFVDCTNYGSLANILNHVGFVAQWFYKDVPVEGARFDIALPLTPAGVTNNRIDLEKTQEFVKSAEAGREYALIPCAEFAKLARMYAETPFRVVAFLKAGPITPEPSFLAIPEESFRE
jgi:hypothetical protein